MLAMETGGLVSGDYASWQWHFVRANDQTPLLLLIGMIKALSVQVPDFRHPRQGFLLSAIPDLRCPGRQTTP